MEATIAPFPPRIAKQGKRQTRRSQTLTQAVDIQAIMHYAASQLALDFRHASTQAERKDLMPHLAKATDAWRIATDARHNAQGRPRAGSLSPAERAEMRRRKSSKASRSVPKLSSKESLSAPAPSGRSGEAGGAAGERSMSGVPSLTGSAPSDEPKVSAP